MSRAIDNELDVLHRAKFESDRGSSYRPCRGQNVAALRLMRRGLLKEAGIAAMWPHRSYVITEAGLSILTQDTPEPAAKGKNK